MRLENLPNEVLFQILRHLNYTDLFSLLQIPSLVPSLRQIMRLVKCQGNEDYENTFHPFDAFEGLIPDDFIGEFKPYTITLQTMLPNVYSMITPAHKDFKAFILSPQAEDDDVVDLPMSNIHDRMNVRSDSLRYQICYAPILRKGATMVTMQRAVSLDGDIDSYCTVRGPDLKVLRLAYVQKAHCELFEGLTVATLIISVCSQDVLNLALHEVQHNTSIKTLDVIGIPRIARGLYRFELETAQLPLGTAIHGLTFDNLTKLSLRMMRSITDLTLPKVKELYITLIADKHIGSPDVVISRLENISGPEVTHLGLCFFAKLPVNKGLDFPNCQQLKVSYEPEKPSRLYPLQDEEAFVFDATSYSSNINLPYPKEVHLTGCIQLINPGIFKNVENLVIQQTISTHFDKESIPGYFEAPILKSLYILCLPFLNLPPIDLKGPHLKELRVQAPSDCDYCHPAIIKANFPELEELEIEMTSVDHSHSYSSDTSYYKDVKFTSLHSFSAKYLRAKMLTNWMATFENNSLKYLEIGWQTSFGDIILLEDFWTELERQKKSLVELSIHLGSYDNFENLWSYNDLENVPKGKECYLQGFEKLTTLSIAGAANLIVKDCPELLTITVNSEPETEGPPRLCIGFIQLKNLPRLERVSYRADQMLHQESGLKCQLMPEGDKKIVQVCEGVPATVVIHNPCMTEQYQIETTRRLIVSRMYELYLLIRSRVPEDRVPLVNEMRSLRSSYLSLPELIDGLKTDHPLEDYDFFVSGGRIYLDSDEWIEDHEGLGFDEDSDFDDMLLNDFEERAEHYVDVDDLDLIELMMGDDDFGDEDSDDFDETSDEDMSDGGW